MVLPFALPRYYNLRQCWSITLPVHAHIYWIKGAAPRWYYWSFSSVYVRIVAFCEYSGKVLVPLSRGDSADVLVAHQPQTAANQQTHLSTAKSLHIQTIILVVLAIEPYIASIMACFLPFVRTTTCLHGKAGNVRNLTALGESREMNQKSKSQGYVGEIIVRENCIFAKFAFGTTSLVLSTSTEDRQSKMGDNYYLFIGRFTTIFKSLLLENSVVFAVKWSLKLPPQLIMFRYSRPLLLCEMQLFKISTVT